MKRMDNALIVVDDLDAVKAFFLELGMKLEGETTVEGPSVGELIGLKDVRATLAMLRPPDGPGGIELDKFHTPDPITFGPVDTPVNALGLRRLMFAVDALDDVLARMQLHGVEVIGEMRYGGHTSVGVHPRARRHHRWSHRRTALTSGDVELRRGWCGSSGDTRHPSAGCVKTSETAG